MRKTLRVFTAGLIALTASAVCAQQRPPQESLFGKVRPQITIVVKEHVSGADMVEMTLLEARYPPELLRNQIGVLGLRLGSEPRGVQVYSETLGDNDRLAFTKASFAVDGLIDRPMGIVRLGPIAQAFSGAPEGHRIEALTVIFDGEVPNARTVQTFHTDHVSVEGRYNRDFGGLEYIVALRTQDPELLSIPETVAQAERASAQNSSAPRTDWLLWTLLGIAAVAAGCLVYWSLLRAPAGARR
jgi:hypothetical protein